MTESCASESLGPSPDDESTSAAFPAEVTGRAMSERPVAMNNSASPAPSSVSAEVAVEHEREGSECSNGDPSTSDPFDEPLPSHSTHLHSRFEHSQDASPHMAKLSISKRNSSKRIKSESVHLKAGYGQDTDHLISWFKAELATANNIIISLCNHLQVIGLPGEHDLLAAQIHSIISIWSPHIAGYFSPILEVQQLIQSIQWNRFGRLIVPGVNESGQFGHFIYTYVNPQSPPGNQFPAQSSPQPETSNQSQHPIKPPNLRSSSLSSQSIQTDQPQQTHRTTHSRQEEDGQTHPLCQPNLHSTSHSQSQSPSLSQPERLARFKTRPRCSIEAQVPPPLPSPCQNLDRALFQKKQDGPSPSPPFETENEFVHDLTLDKKNLPDYERLDKGSKMYFENEPREVNGSRNSDLHSHADDDDTEVECKSFAVENTEFVVPHPNFDSHFLSNRKQDLDRNEGLTQEGCSIEREVKVIEELHNTGKTANTRKTANTERDSARNENEAESQKCVDQEGEEKKKCAMQLNVEEETTKNKKSLELNEDLLNPQKSRCNDKDATVSENIENKNSQSSSDSVDEKGKGKGLFATEERKVYFELIANHDTEDEDHKEGDEREHYNNQADGNQANAINFGNHENSQIEYFSLPTLSTPVTSPSPSVCSRISDGSFKVFKVRKEEPKCESNFVCHERISGELINVVEGLELHHHAFGSKQCDEIVRYIEFLQLAGEKCKLQGRTFCDSRKQIRGNGRIIIQFGCFYNYLKDRRGMLPGILQDEMVEPIPQFFQGVISQLIASGIIDPEMKPDSVMINIYPVGACIPPHTDHEDFERPICTLSLLSSCDILFGFRLFPGKSGHFNGPFKLQLPVGSVLVMKGNSANVAKHAISSVRMPRISITFRKMKPDKVPPKHSLAKCSAFSFDSFPPAFNSDKLSNSISYSNIGRLDTMNDMNGISVTEVNDESNDGDFEDEDARENGRNEYADEDADHLHDWEINDKGYHFRSPLSASSSSSSLPPLQKNRMNEFSTPSFQSLLDDFPPTSSSSSPEPYFHTERVITKSKDSNSEVNHGSSWANIVRHESYASFPATNVKPHRKPPPYKPPNSDTVKKGIR